jgi:hypothetical protein
MLRIAANELAKYVRAFVIIIIVYVLFMTIVVSRFDAKNFFQYDAFDLQTFQVVNSSFRSLISSAIPFTIILNICNEFKNGYALKLISNGLSRVSYCAFKLVLAATLALVSMLLYIVVVAFLISIHKTSYFDSTIFFNSLPLVVVFSMFFSTIAVCLAVLLRTWQYAILAYYGYATVEAVLVVRFQEGAAWVKYLPFNLSISIFQMQALPEKFSDYMAPACIILPFCLVIVWGCTHFFKKADL